jgi:DNA-binding transcriptional MerR regulator
MQTPQILTLCEIDGLTLEDLRQQVEAVRGRSLPPRTLYFWLEKLCIERDAEGYYSKEDADILKALAHWLKRPGAKIKPFKQRLQHYRSQHYAS